MPHYALCNNATLVAKVHGPNGESHFRHKKNRARWIQEGGTWGMISGIRNELSLEF